MSDEKITSIKTLDHSITPNLSYCGTKTRVEFNGSCLKQDKITFNHGKTLNIYIVYEITKNINISDYPTLENCLFGAVSFTKNTDIDKYKYCGYGIGFNRRGSFSILGIGLGRNVRIFGVDMSSSVHIDNKKKDILILDKGSAKRLEKMYLINFAERNKNFCLSLHYNGASSYLFVNGKKFINLRQKILRL